MKFFLSILFVISILIFFCFAQCKKENNPLNITLYDKPLSTIQSYLSGKWKLQYSSGGIANLRYPAKNNSYMIVKNNKITIGNDSVGIIVDTTIVWSRVKDIYGDSTYLLTYSYSRGYIYPYTYVVERIYNDTLVISDNAYDPVSYSYLKSNQ